MLVNLIHWVNIETLEVMDRFRGDVSGSGIKSSTGIH